nr:ribonuclease H-like domain-containing protein [Tanacetum cinerariifolium]
MTNTTSISPLPKSPFHALQNSHWNNAMHDEYNVLVKNGTWILVPRPAGYATRVGFYHIRCDSSLFILRQGSQKSLYGLKQAPRFSDLQVMPLVLDFTTSVVTLPYLFFVGDL